MQFTNDKLELKNAVQNIRQRPISYFSFSQFLYKETIEFFKISRNGNQKRK